MLAPMPTWLQNESLDKSTLSSQMFVLFAFIFFSMRDQSTERIVRAAPSVSGTAPVPGVMMNNVWPLRFTVV